MHSLIVYYASRGTQLIFLKADIFRFFLLLRGRGSSLPVRDYSLYAGRSLELVSTAILR